MSISSRPSARSTMIGALSGYTDIWVNPCHTARASRATQSLCASPTADDATSRPFRRARAGTGILARMPELKVWIDQDLCTGDGICVELQPGIFGMHDDGLAYVKETGWSDILNG